MKYKNLVVCVIEFFGKNLKEKVRKNLNQGLTFLLHYLQEVGISFKN